MEDCYHRGNRGHATQMRISSKPFQQFAQALFEDKDAMNNYVAGIEAVGVPRIFYCQWLPESTESDKQTKEIIIKNYPNCCFNHRVGLPTRKFETDNATPENIEVPLTGTNRRQIENYDNNKKYSEDKCRGSGTTELLTIRKMIFKYAVMNILKNRKCVIVPGTSGKLAMEISTRIKAVCDRIPQVYLKIPTSRHPMEFLFKSGGRINLTSATADAIRGWGKRGGHHT